jgi:predicted nucleic acid-binding protein
MPTWLWVVIAIAALVVVAVAAYGSLRTRRTRTLRERFGPEYDRVAADAPSRRQAEAELQERERRREELDIRPLDPADRDRYRARWQDLQARFVDDPAGAVADADLLIQEVMRLRGYPVDDFDTRAADLSVDHPDVVEHYRAAHGIAVGHERGKAGTDDLRHAVRHYRALFESLVDVGDTQEVRS